MAWSMPLPSTSDLPFGERHVSVVTARAVTTTDPSSPGGRSSRTVTTQVADSTVRPARRPRSAVPVATCASVRAKALPGSTQAASSAAGSAAVTAAARASR